MKPKSNEMAMNGPQDWAYGAAVPAHVTTFQSNTKGFGEKYLPGLSKNSFPKGSKKSRKAASFSEAVDLFRESFAL
jgi:hypothetical protein